MLFVPIVIDELPLIRNIQVSNIIIVYYYFQQTRLNVKIYYLIFNLSIISYIDPFVGELWSRLREEILIISIII